MIKISIAEDDSSCRKQLEDYLNEYGRTNKLEFSIESYENGKQLLEDYQLGTDVVFLDIEMPEMDGMVTATGIRKIDENAVVVFITNMAQYAIFGYEVGALDFILKPLTFQRFSMKMQRILNRVQHRSYCIITVAFGDKVIKLNSRDIYYVEIRKHVLTYYTAEGEYAVRGSLRDAERQLSQYQFIKCNKCYLVNLRHVSQLEKESVIVGGASLEVSRRMYKEFRQKVVNYMGGDT